MEDQRELESSNPSDGTVVPEPADDTPSEPALPLEPAPPITSRFLYVDVAAQRAKQLRRGARLRFDLEAVTPPPKKPERQAMEEVRRCLVQYAVPVWKGVRENNQDADTQE